MSALGYIKTSLKKWDVIQYKDYKVKKIIFICHRTMFLQIPGVKYLTWNNEEFTFGIVQFPSQIRVSKCAAIMPNTEFFKALKSQCNELIKLAKSDTDTSEKDIARMCVEYYLDFLQYQC